MECGNFKNDAIKIRIFFENLRGPSCLLRATSCNSSEIFHAKLAKKAQRAQRGALLIPTGFTGGYSR